MVRFLIQDLQSQYHEIFLTSDFKDTSLEELYAEVSSRVCIDRHIFQLKAKSSGVWLSSQDNSQISLLEALSDADEDCDGMNDDQNSIIMLEMMMAIDGGIDFQHREGGKTGSGGQLSEAQAALERKERLRRLALETIDITKDPYIMKNHLGTYECKLCLTLHPNEGNYLAHTQGKRHQYNLGRRAAMEAKTQARSMAPLVNLTDKAAANAESRKRALKIGRPGYKVTKSRDLTTRQRSLLFEIDYPEVNSDVQPRHRFMSAFEQKVEIPDKNYQYLLFACEPYETVAFKIPNDPIDKREGRFFSHWDAEKKHFALQLYFVDGALTVPTASTANVD
jgi:splicing factor 3A subunit 2